MSNSNERRWRRHMADEDTAIAAQQAAAGGEHSPVAVPLAYGNEELEELARARVLQARRECAKLIEDVIREHASRSQREVPIEQLQALVARMLAS